MANKRCTDFVEFVKHAVNVGGVIPTEYLALALSGDISGLKEAFIDGFDKVDQYCGTFVARAAKLFVDKAAGATVTYATRSSGTTVFTTTLGASSATTVVTTSGVSTTYTTTPAPATTTTTTTAVPTTTTAVPTTTTAAPIMTTAAPTMTVGTKKLTEAEQILKDQVKLFSLFDKDLQSAISFYNSHNELHNKSSNPCNKPSTNQYIKDYDTDQIFPQESLDKDKLKSLPIKHLKKEKTCSSDKDFNIPKDLHYVWFSSTSYTDEQRKTKFGAHNKYLAENLASTKGWGHYLWTNDISFIPKDIKAELELKGVQILSIDSLNFVGKTGSLLNAAKQFAEEQSFGLATDIARYLVLKEKGGVYIDGDYKILNKDGLEKLMCSYDSFFGVERGYDVRLGNGFLAAAPKHNIIKEVIKLSYRNIFETNDTPEYVKYPYTSIMRTLVTTGPVALSVAFAKGATEKDALLPYGYLNILEGDTKEITSSSFCNSLHAWEVKHSKPDSSVICNEIGELAVQDFSQSWQLSGEITYESACKMVL